jgi:hypothetical protein
MKTTIKTPRVPNFIQVQTAGYESNWYPLTAFEDLELETLAQAWRDDLFKRRDEQVKSPPKSGTQE